MAHVEDVRDYERWVRENQHHRNMPQPGEASRQVNQDGRLPVNHQRQHHYEYIPQYDNHHRRHPRHPYAWSAPQPPAQPVYWPGMYGWGPGYNWAGLNNPYGHRHHWYGRTTREVQADNAWQAMTGGMWEHRPRGQEMVPRNPRDDQQFWVRELDGTNTLRHFNTIDNDLRPGYWVKSAYGNSYFIRLRE